MLKVKQYIFENQTYLKFLEYVRQQGYDLFGQVENLEPYQGIGNRIGLNVPITYLGYPGLTDGKICTIWSDFEKFVGMYNSLACITVFVYECMLCII